MTEQEVSDRVCVCHDTVAERRRQLGLKEGVDYTIENKMLVYTTEGEKRILAAFGVQEAAGPAAATPGAACEAVGPEIRTLATAPVVWAKVTRAKPNEKERNDRFFVAVVLDAHGRATGRVLDLFCAKQGKLLNRGRVVQALDMGNLLVLDRAELRRRGLNVR